MKNYISALVGVFALSAGSSALTADVGNTGSDFAARIEVIPFQTLTLSDEQFLTGNEQGTPVTIAGTLAVPAGSGHHPLVVLIHGSGGISANVDMWQRNLLEMGVGVFYFDSFAGRGITSTVYDQSKLGRLNMILDLYRSLAVLATNPMVDSSRIAVMGFSRGGQAALYSAMLRFQRMWNRSGVDPVAYIALYPSCITQFIDETNVSTRPIRIFHGISDDYAQIEPCRRYFKSLTGHARDVRMVEYPNTWHIFDRPTAPTTPTVVRNAQTFHCVLKEQPRGSILNTETGRPFTWRDPCIGRDPHVAYSPAASAATRAAVDSLLRTSFPLR